MFGLVAYFWRRGLIQLLHATAKSVAAANPFLRNLSFADERFEALFDICSVQRRPVPVISRNEFQLSVPLHPGSPASLQFLGVLVFLA